MTGRRPSLTPDQQDEIRRRLAAGGVTVRALAEEYGVGKTTIANLGGQTGQIRDVAQKLAEAQTELARLPPAQQHVALSLAEKLRSISASLASAAELGAKTAHRLQALSNSEVAKVDDADPMASIESLRNVGVLTKLANESAAIALNLVAANKEAVVRLNTETPKAPAIAASRLSTEALREIVAARSL